MRRAEERRGNIGKFLDLGLQDALLHIHYNHYPVIFLICSHNINNYMSGIIYIGALLLAEIMYEKKRELRSLVAFLVAGVVQSRSLLF